MKFKIFNRNLENITPGRLLKKYKLLPIIRGMIIIQGVFYMLTHLSFHYSKTIIVTLTSFIIIQPDYGGRLYSKSQLITGIQSISVRVQKLGNIFWTFIENWVWKFNQHTENYDLTENVILVAFYGIFKIENRFKTDRVITFIRWGHVENLTFYVTLPMNI